MRRFVNHQGSEAIVRPIANGKFRVRIKDCKGTTFVSEVVDCEDDIGGVLNKYADGYWIEKNI